MVDYLVLLQYALSFGFLGAASIQDMKTMEVSNKIWLLYGLTALVLSSVIVVTGSPLNAMFYFINAGVTTMLSLALWYVGAYGGADAKALVCVGFAHSTSLLVFAYSGVLLLVMNFVQRAQKKKRLVPAIPVITFALALTLVHVLL